MNNTPAPVSTAIAAASIWSGVGEVKTCPGQAASSMPWPTKPACSGSCPDPPPDTSATLPLLSCARRTNLPSSPSATMPECASQNPFRLSCRMPSTALISFFMGCLLALSIAAHAAAEPLSPKPLLRASDLADAFDGTTLRSSHRRLHRSQSRGRDRQGAQSTFQELRYVADIAREITAQANLTLHGSSMLSHLSHDAPETRSRRRKRRQLGIIAARRHQILQEIIAADGVEIRVERIDRQRSDRHFNHHPQRWQLGGHAVSE